MTHPDEDQLLKYELKLRPEEESRITAEHLAECVECRTLLAELHGQVESLGRMTPRVHDFPLPHSPVRRTSFAFVPRAAAALLMLCLAGWGISVLWFSPPVHVLPSDLHPRPPADSLSRYAACDATAFTHS